MPGDDAYGPLGPGWRHSWAILVRRRWWLMGPLFLCGLAGFVLAHKWPRLYRSEALILVEQPAVPEQPVTPNLTADAKDRLQTWTQLILSRTRLARLVEQFNPYPRERSRKAMDDLVDKMLSEIKIEPVRAPGGGGEPTAFTVSFAAENPRVAQQVTDQLTSILMEQNMSDRAQGSEDTANLLEKQIEEARQDLEETEQRQREYKVSSLGELPEQEQSNSQILGSLETQLRTASDALARAEQQKIYLESLRNEYLASQQKVAPTGEVAPGAAAAPAAGTADLALRNLRDQLTQLEAKYTPQHPDVIRVKREISQWESLKQQMDAAASDSANPKPRADTGATNGQAMIEIDAGLKASAAEIAGYRKDVAELRQRIDGLQSRLKLTPVREEHLTEVNQAYEQARDHYQSLLAKQLEWQLAAHPERSQRGEQLRVLDPASLPQRPSEPDQGLITLAGWSVGLGLGIILMVLREGALGVLSNETDVGTCTRLPVLVRIPVLRSPGEQARRNWLRALEVSAVAVLVLASIGTSVYTYWVG